MGTLNSPSLFPRPSALLRKSSQLFGQAWTHRGYPACFIILSPRVYHMGCCLAAFGGSSVASFGSSLSGSYMTLTSWDFSDFVWREVSGLRLLLFDVWVFSATRLFFNRL